MINYNNIGGTSNSISNSNSNLNSHSNQSNDTSPSIKRPTKILKPVLNNNNTETDNNSNSINSNTNTVTNNQSNNSSKQTSTDFSIRSTNSYQVTLNGDRRLVSATCLEDIIKNIKLKYSINDIQPMRINYWSDVYNTWVYLDTMPPDRTKLQVILMDNK